MNTLHRAILAVSALVPADFSLLVASQGTPQQRAVHEERMVCPSMDFSAFFHDFSESAAVQMRFTRLPLIYGEVDLLSPPSPGIGYPFLEDKIESYEKIPTLNHDNGLVFPDEKERTVGRPSGGELKFSMTFGLTDDFRDAPAISDLGRNSDIVTVILYLNESGYQVHYRFRKEKNCWFLVRIDNWST